MATEIIRTATGASIEGVTVTYATAEIRNEIESYLQENDKITLPVKYGFELMPSAFHGKVAKIVLTTPIG